VSERLIIIDGYNLILRSPHLRPDHERTLRESREKLLNLLAWAIGTGEATFLVVFDGAEGGGRDSTQGRVQVRFSRSPEKADDLIRSLVEDRIETVERLTVVTADLEVARHARAMGADVALADLFLASAMGVASGGEPEKPAGLTKAEVEQWAEIFRRRSGPREAAGDTGEDESD